MSGHSVHFACGAPQWLLPLVLFKTRCRLSLTSYWLMITKNRPFRVACWALMIAFGLSILVALTDPRSVRQAILAKADERGSAFDSDALLVADSDAVPSTHEPSGPAPEVNPRSLLTQTPTRQPNLAGRASTARVALESSTVVSSQPVSSRTGRQRTDLEREQRQPARAMLVVSPDDLQGEASRSSDVEFLPPPPEAAHEVESWDKPDLADDSSLPPQTEPSPEANLSRRWLEMEILSLRQEVQRLAEAQQIAEQLDRLQQQQQQLLSMHQNLPDDRLLEVINLLHQQLTSVRATFPPPPRDPQSPAAHLVEETSQLIGEVSSSGNGRLSLKITEADLDDILNLLERMTGTPVGKLPPAQLTVPEETHEIPQLSLPTAAKPTELQPLSYEQPIATEPRASQCASCHKGSMRP